MNTQDIPQRLDSWEATAATPFRKSTFLWVELTRDPSTLFHDLCDLYLGRRIADHERLPAAIEDLSPAFICFEDDYPRGGDMRLLAEAGAYYPDVPLVMLTHDHSKETMVWAYRNGATSYMVKPITLHQLVREIRTLLALARNDAPSPPRSPPKRLTSQSECVGAQGPRRTASRTAAALIRVEQGFAENLRLGHAAMACHMSASHFSRTFKKEHDTSFRRYLLRYRLERACEFLAMAEIPVKQAAFAAGFNDCSYFDRVFRRRYGMTPRDYQATHSAPRPDEAGGTQGS